MASTPVGGTTLPVGSCIILLVLEVIMITVGRFLFIDIYIDLPAVPKKGSKLCSTGSKALNVQLFR